MWKRKLLFLNNASATAVMETTNILKKNNLPSKRWFLLPFEESNTTAPDVKAKYPPNIWIMSKGVNNGFIICIFVQIEAALKDLSIP